MVEDSRIAKGGNLLASIQGQHFMKEITDLKKGHQLHKASPLIPLHPFLDAHKIIRVGGHEQNSNCAYSNQHPVILHGSHPITCLIIRSEHIQLALPSSHAHRIVTSTYWVGTKFFVPSHVHA